MPVVTNVLRAAAGLLGVAFALLALSVPILGISILYNEPAMSSLNHTDHRILGGIAYALTILAFTLFGVLVSMALLRYARYGKRQTNSPIGHSL